MFTHNKFSSTGMLFGLIALVTGIIHFSVGPVARPAPTLETVVAQQVTAVKRGIIAGLKGEKVTQNEHPSRIDIDKVLDIGGIVLAIFALALGTFGGMRKENRCSINGALLFGGGTLAFHALIFGIMIVCAILLLMAILSWLAGGLSF